MLNHLHKTLETCIEYHTDKGNTIKVAQLKLHLELAEKTILITPDNKTAGLYLNEGL